MVNERTAGCSMLKNHEACTVAKTTVCMCVGVWVCVLPINTGSADKEVTEAPEASRLSAHPGANAPNTGRDTPFA